MEEEPTLGPAFRQIFVHLRRREELRKLLVNHDDPKGGSYPEQTDEVIEDLVQKLGTEEVNLLSSLTSLANVTESTLRAKGASLNATHLIHSFKPFEFACSVVRAGANTSARYHAILCEINENKRKDPIAEVLFAHVHDGQAVSQFGLALDLLQYWELTLRNQTELQCEEFCNGVRKSLWNRIKTSHNSDKIVKLIPGIEQSISPRVSVEAIVKDVSDRLSRVILRLEQMDSLQAEFRSHSSNDFSIKLKRQRLLYEDELATVLSELVHLSDNLEKWLVANNRDRKDLRVVEQLNCYRAASCFVNTRKHGVRGRGKTSAVGEYEVVAKDENKKIVFVDLMINYKGEGWQATRLIDDLLQAWELFIRYYTSIDISVFRRDIGIRFASREKLSIYTSDLGESITNNMVQRSTERMHYDI